jgi:hypothetical protein
MPVKQLETPYPVIDVDPHFSRVVRYMRPNDYLLWGGVTASGPLIMALWDKMDPSKATHGIRHASRFAGCMGFAAGFFLAYQNSSCELGWGGGRGRKDGWGVEGGGDFGVVESGIEVQ